MKLIRGKYDLTLNEVSRMFETSDFSALKRFRWLPAFIALKQYERFSMEFAGMFNKDTLNNLIDNDVLRLRIEHIILNVLPVLTAGLMTGDPRFASAFKKRYNRDYTGTADDLELIKGEIEKLTGRYKSLVPASQIVEEKGKGSLKFEEIITYTEMILERSIDRNMKLYQFEYQYKLAVRKAEELQKMNQKYKTSG